MAGVGAGGRGWGRGVGGGVAGVKTFVLYFVFYCLFFDDLLSRNGSKRQQTTELQMISRVCSSFHKQEAT